MYVAAVDVAQPAVQPANTASVPPPAADKIPPAQEV